MGQQQPLHVLLGERPHVHAADVAAEPHHRRLADLQVQVGRLVLHDHAEELVDLRLARPAARRAFSLRRRTGCRRGPSARRGRWLRGASSAPSRLRLLPAASDRSGARTMPDRARRARPGTPWWRGCCTRCSGRCWRPGRRRPRPSNAWRRCSGLAGPAAGDDRDAHRLGDGPRHRQVVAGLGAVGVHRGQHDLAGPELLDRAAPRRRLPGRSASRPPLMWTSQTSLAVLRCTRRGSMLTTVAQRPNLRDDLRRSARAS